MEKKQQRILPSTIILIVLGIISISLIFLLASGNRFEKKGLSQKPKTVKNQLSGDIWLISSKEKIKSGEDFDIDVYINTKGNDLGVFALNLAFDKKDLTINTESGEGGIDKGKDGADFMVMSNPGDVSTGHLRFSGICAQDCVNGNKKNIAIIHAKAQTELNFADSSSQIEVKELSTALGKAITFKNSDGVILIK